MAIEFPSLLKMSILTSSRTFKLNPSYLQAQFSPSWVLSTARAPSFDRPFHLRTGKLLSVSFFESFQWISSFRIRSSSLLASISSSAALSGSGGGGGDGLPGGAGGGGGSSGREAETGPLVGEAEGDPVGSDVIFLSVGGMTCGGCASSVKRILESHPQVASASVQLKKEIAVVWPIPEAKDAENWQQQLGEKLASHLSSCGFKSIFQGKL